MFSFYRRQERIAKVNSVTLHNRKRRKLYTLYKRRHLTLLSGAVPDNKPDRKSDFRFGGRCVFQLKKLLNGNLRPECAVLTDSSQGWKNHFTQGNIVKSRNRNFLRYSDPILIEETDQLDGVVVRNRKNGKSVSVSFGDFDYLLIWTIPEAPYVCIEPWTAPPSYQDEGYDITKKEGTTKIEPSESFKTKHIIYF